MQNTPTNIIYQIKEAILEKRVLYFVVLSIAAMLGEAVLAALGRWLIFAAVPILYIVLLWIGFILQMMREKGVI